MSKERLLVAKTVEMQLQFAVKLLGKAVDNLTALRYGVEPALTNAKRAFAETEKSLACTLIMIENIPDSGR